jgi:hypothetical protein
LWAAYRGLGCMSGLEAGSPDLFCSAGGGFWPMTSLAAFARALSVQPAFSQHLVYAPDRDFARMVQD